ncbi:MAG: 3-hydroxylacyl-ACP dehydratase [Casimicrobiaceae bacterium]
MLSPRWPPIASLLPHTGSMIMPQEILHFDKLRLTCSTRRHRAADNPLRCDGRLAALAGIEFAAQAMALHGALRRSPPAALRHGRLVSVRDVAITRPFLDDVEAPLIIECVLQVASADVFAYDFSVGAASGEPMVQGRATVMMAD